MEVELQADVVVVAVEEVEDMEVVWAPTVAVSKVAEPLLHDAPSTTSPSVPTAELEGQAVAVLPELQQAEH